MQYRVKVGHTAFLGGSLRDAGYLHQVEKPYKRLPSWAEKVSKKSAEEPRKAEESRKAEPKPGAVSDGPSLDDLVGLESDDGKAVQL